MERKKLPKPYKYLPALMAAIFNVRLDVSSINKKRTMQENDPRRIAPNLAAVPKPERSVLVEKYKNRFK